MELAVRCRPSTADEQDVQAVRSARAESNLPLWMRTHPCPERWRTQGREDEIALEAAEAEVRCVSLALPAATLNNAAIATPRVSQLSRDTLAGTIAASREAPPLH